jgi:predicted Zn-dependent peptidase
MSDIQTVTRPEAEEFGRRYYTPANAACALVGNLDVEQCKRIVERYFGRLPAGPEPPPITTREPEQRGERRVKVEWDAEPDLIIGYHKCHPLHDGEAVFDVIDAVLSRGRTSRLYKTLVLDRRLATSIGTWTGPTQRDPNLFMVTAEPLHPHTTREVEEAIDEVLETLITDPPEGDELEKVRNNLRADLLRAMQSNRGLASRLSYYQAVFDDWQLAQKQLEKIERVTTEDVRRVAEKYFLPTRRTVGEIVKVAAPSEKGQ